MKKKSQNKVCNLILDPQYGIIFIKLPWTNLFVRGLISQIKPLRWNEEEEACEAPIEFANLIEYLASLYFDEVIIDELEDEEPEEPEHEDKQIIDHWVALGKLLSKDDVQSIRKLLAKKYHPDNNPTDITMMGKLNAIFDKLGEEKV